MENSLEILKTIPYSQLYLWDVRRYSNDVELISKYKLVPLYSLLSQSYNYEKIQDEKEYYLCGLSSYGNGLFHREIKLGKEIKGAKLNQIKKGEFIYSRLGANNGSFDIVSEQFDKYWVTNEFPTFNISNELNPEYLKIIFRLERYWKIISRKLQGAAHKRFKEKLLLDLKIPLPSLTEQNRLVANYNAKIQLANEQEQKAKELEQEIEEYLFEVLGIKKLEDKKIVKGLQYVNYKNLDRWDVLAKDLRTLNGLSNCKYELKKIGEVFEFPSRTWKKKEYKSSTFKYIELGAIDPTIGITELKEIEVKNAPSRATQQVKTGDFLIGTTRPYLKRFVIIEPKYDGYICSSGFSIVAPNSNYNLFYLKEFLMSYFGIEQLKNKMTGGTYPAITNNELKEILVPLPKVEIQNDIANHISSLRQQIKDLKSQAEENREKAIKEFEQEIFN